MIDNVELAADGAEDAPAADADPAAPGATHNGEGARRTGFDAARKEAFLAALVEYLNVSQAARAVGVTPKTVWLHRRTCPAFARRWLEAMDQAYVEAELLLLRSVRDGGLEDVTTVTPLDTPPATPPRGEGGAAGADDASSPRAARRPRRIGPQGAARGGSRTTRQSPRILMGVALRLMQLRQANMVALTLLREAQERDDAPATAPDIERLKDRARALLGVINEARIDRPSPAGPAAATGATATHGEGAGDGRQPVSRRR